MDPNNKRFLFIGAGALVLILIVTLIVLNFTGKEPKATELNLVTYQQDKDLKNLLTEFGKANSLKVNFTVLDKDTYELKSLDRIASGQVDVWGIPNDWLYKNVDKLSGFNTKPDDYKSLYADSVSNANIINNKIYGYPLSIDALVLFTDDELKSNLIYNSKLSDEDRSFLRQKPENWDDLARQAQLLTQKSGGNIITAGLAMGTGAIASAPQILATLMMQFGAQMNSADNNSVTFQTSINKFGGAEYPGARALDFYTSFAKKDNANYSFSDSLGGGLEAFSSGKAVFYIDYSSVETEIKFQNSKLDFSSDSLPQVKLTKNPVNNISFETFTLPATSKNKVMAEKLVKYISSSQTNQVYFRQTKKASGFKTYVEENKGEVIPKAILTAQNWTSPDPAISDKAFRDGINQVLQGKSAQTVLEGIASQLNTSF